MSLISLSTSPPWSPPSAWAGAAAVIDAMDNTTAAQTGIDIDVFP
jgi:hypothetical protein